MSNNPPIVSLDIENGSNESSIGRNKQSDPGCTNKKILIGSWLLMSILLMIAGFVFLLFSSRNFEVVEGTLMNKYIYTQNCYECPLNSTCEQCPYMRFQLEDPLGFKCTITSPYDQVIYDKFNTNDPIQYVKNHDDTCTYYNDYYEKLDKSKSKNLYIGLPMLFSGFVITMISIGFAVKNEIC